MDDDDFNVALLPSSDVKKAPMIGTVLDFYGADMVWYKGEVSSVEEQYTVPARDIMYVVFDSLHDDCDKSVVIDIRVEHPPLEVGDEPLSESFEVDAGYVEPIDMNVNAGDTARIFGKVTKGNDITVHILSKLYETPDAYHTDKAYFTKEKVGEIEIEYHCTRTEPLLILFDNEYSYRTSKTVDVSIQIIRGAEPEANEWLICPFCQQKNPKGSTACQHCEAKL